MAAVLAVISAPGHGQGVAFADLRVSPDLSVEQPRLSLKEFLTVLEKKYGVRFAYSKSRLQIPAEGIDVRFMEGSSVEEILRNAFRDVNLKFEKMGSKYYVIYSGDNLNDAEKRALKKTYEEYQQQDALPLTRPSGEASVAVAITVTGRVTNAEDGSPLPGVNVLVKGTTMGTVTDIDGRYAITTEDVNAVLVFSFIGYETSEVAINGQTVIDVKLTQALTELGEVVVNALGFEEDKDKMGSSASVVGVSDILRSGETGLVNSIAGKASGVAISRSSGSDPGAGSFIQIRGQNTLGGNAQPLIIIDGVPVSNSINHPFDGTRYRGVVQQSRLNDVDPNDIASVQILKGASAAALWGSRAANGVIVITTKSGSYNQKMNISFNSTLSLDEVSRMHPFQEKFGQGTAGAYNPTAQHAWGDKISERAGGADLVDQNGQFFEGYQTGKRYYPILQKNSRGVYTDSNFDKIFQTGHYIDNNLSINGGGENLNYFISFGDLYQEGVFKHNSDYRRTTMRINLEGHLNDIFRVSVKSNYSRVMSNRIQRSNNTAGMMLPFYRMTPDYELGDYKGSWYSSPTAAPIINRQRSYRNYLGSTGNPVYNDPLWTMYEQDNPSSVHRFINSAELALTPVNWFEVIGRVGVDNYIDTQSEYFPIGDIGALNGKLSEVQIQESQMNFDLIGRAKFSLGENFQGTYLLGFNLNDRKSQSLGGSASDFLIPEGPRHFSNAPRESQVPIQSKTNIRSSRGYTVLGLSAFESVFLNVSLAAEAASTFGEASDKTFYYPSADIAWQFTNLSALKGNSVLSFGKLRAAYGVVGVQPQPYKTRTLFIAGYTQYGSGGYRLSGTLGNQLLRPERKTEYEFGADLRFLDNRLSTSITYYQNEIDDLLLNVSTSPSTGFTSSYKNAGRMENKGLEFDMSYAVIQKKDLQWSVNMNVFRNRSLVTDLAGTSSVQVGGIGGFMTTNAVEGYPVGVFFAGKYERDDSGKIVFDQYGYPTLAPQQGVIGDPNPDWRGGLGSSLTYKKFSVNVLFETFQGGDFYPGTKSVMYSFGTHKDTGNEVTLTQDMTNIQGTVIPAGTTVRGNIKDLGAGPVLLDEAYYTTLGGGFSALKEQFVEDGSWTRLRELSFGYRIDSEGFRNLTRLRSMDIRLTGRNLILWTPVVGFDPDSNHTQDTIGRGLDYFDNPATRSYVFSLTLNL